MAVTITAATAEPRAWSIGPLKMELYSYSIASGDTSIVVTSANLSTVKFAILTGVSHTAESYSNNVVTWTVVDPAASRIGDIMVFGT